MRRRNKRKRLVAGIVALSLLPAIILAFFITYLAYFPRLKGYSDILFDNASYHNAADGHWSLGFAKRSTVPPDLTDKIYYMAGFNSNTRATGILDDTYVRVACLDDNGSGDMGKIVLAAVDCVGLSRKDIQDVKKEMAGYCADNNISVINIMSTHNHEAIDTQGLWGKNYISSGRDEQYMRFLKDQIKEAVQEANESMKGGDLFLGTGNLPKELVTDRRTPYVFDDNIIRLSFVPYDNSGNIYLINFGMHVEALAQINTEISADWVHHMGNVIAEQDPGADFVYINGAIGGLITVPMLDEVYRKGDILYAKEQAEWYGRELGKIVMDIDNSQPLGARAFFRAARVEIPVSNYGFTVFKFFNVINNDVYRTKKSMTIVSEIAYMELGTEAYQLKTLFMPGEIFPELALGGYLSADRSATRRDASNDITFYQMMGEGGVKSIFGLANDQLGYIIPENDFLLHKTLPYLNIAYDHLVDAPDAKEGRGREHYEECVSTGPHTAGVLLDAAQTLMDSIKNG